MKPRLLSEDQVNDCLVPPMHSPGDNERLPVEDFWPYVDTVVDALGPQDEGLDKDNLSVLHISVTADARYHHAFIPLVGQNFGIVMIQDAQGKTIVGHHVLNLFSLYDLPIPDGVLDLERRLLRDA